MNKRTKKKHRKILSTAKQRRRNKKLCDRYPFLIPRNDWTGKIVWENDKYTKKYEFTNADDFPKGWWKAFGIMLCEELREELIKYNYLYKIQFVQVKEKFGALRIYTNGVPEGCQVDEIIDKYSHLSENICITCGKPDVSMVNEGWIFPECFDCYYLRKIKFDTHYKKVNPESHIRTYNEIQQEYINHTNPDDYKMDNTYTVIRFSKDGDEKITFDISETANKIRENWMDGQSDR